MPWNIYKAVYRAGTIVDESLVDPAAIYDLQQLLVGQLVKAIMPSTGTLREVCLASL